jgi:hypothetical protein
MENHDNLSKLRLGLLKSSKGKLFLKNDQCLSENIATQFGLEVQRHYNLFINF